MSRPRHAHRLRRISLGVVSVLAVAGLAGCVGARPRLEPDPTTGYPVADAFIGRIADVSAATFTADYSVSVPMLATTTTATISQSGIDSRGVTIGDVRYVYAHGSSQTCVVSTGACVDGIDAARTSDTTLGHDFFSVGLRNRLRNDLRAATAAPTEAAATIAGRPATCLDIVLPDPTTEGATVGESHCLLDNGVLARISRADVTVELLTVTDVATADLLATPVAPTSPPASTTPSVSSAPAAPSASAPVAPPDPAVVTSVATLNA